MTEFMSAYDIENAIISATDKLIVENWNGIDSKVICKDIASETMKILGEPLTTEGLISNIKYIYKDRGWNVVHSHTEIFNPGQVEFLVFTRNERPYTTLDPQSDLVKGFNDGINQIADKLLDVFMPLLDALQEIVDNKNGDWFYRPSMCIRRTTMMGHRGKLISGDEWDQLVDRKHIHAHPAGVRRKCKRAYNKRQRKASRRKLRMEIDATQI